MGRDWQGPDARLDPRGEGGRGREAKGCRPKESDPMPQAFETRKFSTKRDGVLSIRQKNKAT